MSEERFDRLENMLAQHQNQLNQMQTMMEQLIKMVGHNNAVTELNAIPRMEAKLDILNERLLETETDVRLLKKVR